MRVLYSNQVRKGLLEYKKSLKTYSISKERAIQKTKAMKLALLSVGYNPTINPICIYQDLGQVLQDGQPLIKNLRRFNYKDESGFQWAFSYIINNNDIMFVKMLPSRLVVKEFKQTVMMKESILSEIIERVTKNVLRGYCENTIQESKNKRMIGEYECVDGDFSTCKAPSLSKFGYYNKIRMYYSPTHTYCLMRREDNGTLFFAEIVPAPEFGKKENKFEPRRPTNVPKIILQDAQSLLLREKNRHTLT